jgi:predicted peroxiredoxin
MMKKTGITAGIILALLLGIMAFNRSGNNACPDESSLYVREGMLLHMTHDHNDPHRVLMPLQMAAIMSADRDVLIYLDIDAVRLVTRDAGDIVYGHFTPLKESLGNLLSAGVEIYACPGCMKDAGILPEQLLDGVKIAEKDRFFEFTAGRIITLNY